MDTTTWAVRNDMPEYVTVHIARQALKLTPWQVVELVERGEIQAIRHGALLLCRRYDVEQLGGVLEEAPTPKPDWECPSWCVRFDHEADEPASGTLAVHYGPDFGAFIGIMGETTADVAATLTDDNRDDPTAAELRQLAADAVTAAEWLEALK